MSVRESILAALKTSLARINGVSPYVYNIPAARIQRYTHTWDEDEVQVNTLRTRPAILITPEAETAEMETVDLWANVLRVDVTLFLKGGAASSANDADVNAALADLKRAIFTSWDGLGGLVSNVRMENRKFDEEGVPIDGIHLVLTITYSDTFGDPDTGV